MKANELITKAEKYTYAGYRQLLENLMAEGKTTGTNQSSDMVDYAKLNNQRMSRLDKTLILIPELETALTNLNRNLLWVVITEGWCGDAAQNVPLIGKIAETAPNKINLQLVLRDENLELMDRYLTNGGRSIPKLICFDAETKEELGIWGPRPAEAQELFLSLKSNPNLSKDEFITAVHQWYSQDKTRTMQKEFATLLQQWGNRKQALLVSSIYFSSVGFKPYATEDMPQTVPISMKKVSAGIYPDFSSCYQKKPKKM